jgi:hypothetical protein
LVDTSYKNVVEGCIKYAPESTRGAMFWVDNSSSGVTLDAAALTPQWILACPWKKNWMYIPGDFAAGADGTIYECWDFAYCEFDPDTTEGQLGWGASPFNVSGLTGYDAATCFPQTHYLDLAAPGYWEGAPYKFLDI